MYINPNTYIHDNFEFAKVHFEAHDRQQVKGKLDNRRYHKDYCNYCFLANEFGDSAIFNIFLNWAREQRFNIYTTTARSTAYYIQIYQKVIDKEGFAPTEVKKLINLLFTICLTILKALSMVPPLNGTPNFPFL